MNKGKKEIRIIDKIKYIYYKCERCGVLVHEKNWTGDTHRNCDKYMINKPIRDKVDIKLFGKLL